MAAFAECTQEVSTDFFSFFRTCMHHVACGGRNCRHYE